MRSFSKQPSTTLCSIKHTMLRQALRSMVQRLPPGVTVPVRTLASARPYIMDRSLSADDPQEFVQVRPPSPPSERLKHFGLMGGNEGLTGSIAHDGRAGGSGCL